MQVQIPGSWNVVGWGKQFHRINCMRFFFWRCGKQSVFFQCLTVYIIKNAKPLFIVFHIPFENFSKFQKSHISNCFYFFGFFCFSFWHVFAYFSDIYVFILICLSTSFSCFAFPKHLNSSKQLLSIFTIFSLSSCICF